MKDNFTYSTAWKAGEAGDIYFLGQFFLQSSNISHRVIQIMIIRLNNTTKNYFPKVTTTTKVGLF